MDIKKNILSWENDMRLSHSYILDMREMIKLWQGEKH